MSHAKSFTVAVLAALLCACQAAPTRPSGTPSVSPSMPAWRGVAMLPETAQAPREGTLEVVLVAFGDNDVRALAHAEFAVKPAARIEFALPVDAVRDAASARLGWRVWLRDRSGRLRYASDRIVGASRGTATSVPLSRVALR